MMKRVTLPKLRCKGCTACCQDGSVTLRAGDDPRLYKVKLSIHGTQIANKADGSCIYVGPKGCTIHSKRPSECRAFDCRLWFIKKSPEEVSMRIEAVPSSAAIFKAAIERLP